VYTSTQDPDDLDTRLLRAMVTMVTKGIVEIISDSFVNMVNADFIAKLRGLKFTEERIKKEQNGSNASASINSIQVQLSHVRSLFASALFSGGDIQVEGKVRDGIPHLMRIGSFTVDASLEGNVILCRRVD